MLSSLIQLLYRNGLSAGGAKAVTRSYTSGWYERLCDVRTPDNPPFIVRYYFAFGNLVFKLFSVLKHIILLWIKWIMGRCYLHLWWYFILQKIDLEEDDGIHLHGDGILDLKISNLSSWDQGQKCLQLIFWVFFAKDCVNTLVIISCSSMS